MQDRYFDYIKNGTKRIKLRLKDKKRQKIQLGDEIVFTDNAGKKLRVNIIGLLHYAIFTDLFRDFTIEILADKSMTKDEFRRVLEQFYAPEKQLKYGALGIRFKLK